MIRGISHVGIAVPDLDRYVACFERLLGIEERLRVDARGQGVVASFLPVGDGTELELIRPTGPESGVGRFVARRGAAIHHVCFETDDAEAELRRLEGAGARLLTPTAQVDREGPFRAFGWLHQDSFGGILVEFVEHRPPPGTGAA